MDNRRSNVGAIVALVICAAIPVACAGSDDDAEELVPDEGPWSSVAERPCPKGSFLHWENFGEPFVRSWCTGCHSSQLTEERREEAPVDVNLDSLEGIREHMDRMWTRAADQNATMPPAGGPGEEERALLGEWLACGAPSRTDLDAWE